MQKNLLLLFFLNFCLNASFFAVYNVLTEIIELTIKVRFERLIQYQILQIFKFFGVFISTYFCDKTNLHKYVIASCLLIYPMSILTIYQIDIFCPISIKTNVVLFLLAFSYFSNGSIFPLLDTLFLNHLSQTNQNSKKIGKLKIAGTLGHCISELILVIIHRIRENSLQSISEHSINITVCLFFGFIGTILALNLRSINESIRVNKVNYNEIENNETNQSETDNNSNIYNNSNTHNNKTNTNKTNKNKTNTNKTNKNFFQTISKTLFHTNISIHFYYFCILTIGIDRSAISCLLSKFLRAQNIQKSNIHLQFLCRCIPELFLFSISHIIINYISLDMMVIFSILFTLLRSTIYSSINLLNHSDQFNSLIICIASICKGSNSALWHYSTIRIFQSFSSPLTITLYQGILFNLQNSIASLFFCLFSLFTPQEYNDINKTRFIFSVISLMLCFSLTAPIVRMLKRK